MFELKLAGHPSHGFLQAPPSSNTKDSNNETVSYVFIMKYDARDINTTYNFGFLQAPSASTTTISNATMVR